jgi:hypothetical protein
MIFVEGIEKKGLNRDQVVVPTAEADFFPIIKLDGPVHFRVKASEFILSSFFLTVRQDPVKTFLPVDQVHGGLIDGHRIRGGQDSDIRNDRRIAVTVTIAGRRNLSQEVDACDPCLLCLSRTARVYSTIFF